MLAEHKVVKTVRDGWLDRECLCRSAVQNHRVLTAIQPDDPDLAIASRTAERWECRANSDALRQEFPSAIVAEINRLDLYLGSGLPQLLLRLDA